MLGRGAQGSVYEVDNGVLKVITIERVKNSEYFDQVNKLNIISSRVLELGDPNVIHIEKSGFVSSPSQPGTYSSFCMLMERGECDLTKKVSTLKDDAAAVRNMTEQLVSGARSLHAKKIVHQDLKLDNVLVSGDRYIVSDLDAMEVLDHSTSDVSQELIAQDFRRIAVIAYKCYAGDASAKNVSDDDLNEFAELLKTGSPEQQELAVLLTPLIEN